MLRCHCTSPPRSCPAEVCALLPSAARNCLQGVQTELVCAATMGVAAAALDAHTREALR